MSRWKYVAPKGASVLEIDWADGHRGVYPHEFLRGFCPCALCQGHEGPIGYIEGGNQDLEESAERGQLCVAISLGQTGMRPEFTALSS